MWEPQQLFYFMKCSDKEKLLNIIYIDNHLLVLNKPGDLLTQPDNSQNESLEELAKEYLKKKQNKERVFLQAIHRLDKPVSGLVLFARTSKALGRLNEEIKKKRVLKRYLAQVEGKVLKEKELLTHYIFHDDHKAKIFSTEKAHTKRAELEYRVLRRADEQTLVDIDLLTGRYHQIRAQFSAIGHPVVGDKKYFSKDELRTIRLHAYFLEFFHPISKKKLTFISIYPNSSINLSFF